MDTASSGSIERPNSVRGLHDPNSGETNRSQYPQRLFGIGEIATSARVDQDDRTQAAYNIG
jgi:hypothetical protein